VRDAACTGLYRLCLGHTADNKDVGKFLVPILASLLTFLSESIVYVKKPSTIFEVGLDLLTASVDSIELHLLA
jgi:hypothetical protein